MGLQPGSDSGAVDQVEALVAELLERLANGERDALEALCTAHPEFAGELRVRMSALREMNLVPADAAAMAFPERLGEFRLVRRLGSGGMGVVYEAVQESLGRTVALKLIRPEHLYFERSRERFRRETEAVARLSHPGVVSIYTVGEAQGTPYFAMELIHGATVAQALEQVRGVAPEALVAADLRAAVNSCVLTGAEGAREPRDELFEGSWVDACARVTLRMAQALAHAHERGVLHRDIKPSNIAITVEARVVLFDFGLAGLDSELRLTRSGSALGSVLYMAPEQVAGRIEDIDVRTDVYALGVTLYEMLTLQPPYSGADAEQARAAILEGNPPPIRARNRAVSRDLEIVCLHALDRDRGRRYASMQQFAADLENVLHGRPILVRPPSAAYRTRRWVARHPTLSVALALVGLLGTVLPSALYVQQRNNNVELQRLLQDVSAAQQRATSESERALASAREAELSASFLVGLFGASDPYSSGRRDLTAREMLDAGMQRVEVELAGQPELQARLYERIGLSYNNLDLYEQALVPLERALTLRRELHGADDLRTASALVLVASAQRLSGRPGAAKLLRDAYRIFEATPPEEVGEIVNAEALLALSLIDEGETGEPIELLSRAQKRMEASALDDAGLRWMVATVLATTQLRLGQYGEAEASARTILERETEVPPQLAPWRCAALDTLATALAQQGETVEALAAYEAAVSESEATYGRENSTYAITLCDFADLLARNGESERSLELLEHGARVLREQLGLRHPKAQRGLCLQADAALSAARPELVQGALSAALAELSADPEASSALSPLRFRLALVELALDDAEAAAAHLRGCVPSELGILSEPEASLQLLLARALLATDEGRSEGEQLALAHLEAEAHDVRATALGLAARAAWHARRSPRALELAERALEVLDAAHGDTWIALQTRALVCALAPAEPTSCGELAALSRSLRASLGPRHSDLRVLRELLQRDGLLERCPELR